MCYVIITTRTLLWTLLTIGSTLIMLAAVFTPQWLIGAPRLTNSNHKGHIDNHETTISDSDVSTTGPSHGALSTNHSSRPSDGKVYTPTVGIFNRCTRISHSHDAFEFNCAPFVSSFSMPSDEFPGFWKASLIFFAIGLTLMAFTVGTSIIGCCIRAIVKKSIFTISGTIQSVAGLFYILGLVLYPAGWSSRRVTLLCGEEASYFMIGDCSLGWAFFLAMAGTVLTIFCSVLSVCADTSTSSEKVQDEIYEGKNLICLL